MSLAKLRQASKAALQSNQVAVPELAHLFGKDDEGNPLPPLFYMATLTADEKDAMDIMFADYRKARAMSDDTTETYRAFAVAYCMCEKNDNVRELVDADETQIFSAVDMLKSSIPNKIIARLWNVANGANAFFGVNTEVEKKSPAPTRKQKNAGGNGAPPSTSDTPAAQLGSPK